MRARVKEFRALRGATRGTARVPKRSPAKRVRFEEEESRSIRDMALAAYPGLRSALRRGAAMVSTGAWGRNKRADDPDILKTGNLSN